MNTMKSILFISCLAAFSNITNVFAEMVYKTTDDSGLITYSQEPPAASMPTEAVKIPPGPSAETTHIAQQEARQAVQRADQLVQKRLTYNQKLFAEQEKTRRAAQQRVARQQQYEIRYDSGYPYYPWYSPPYVNSRPPHHRSPTPVPHATPSAGLAMPR